MMTKTPRLPIVLVLLTVATLALTATAKEADACLALAEGATFSAADGCNTCTCLNGQPSCTELVCTAPAPAPAAPGSPQCIATQRPVVAMPFDAFCAAASTFVAAEETAVGCIELDAVCPQQITFARQTESGQLFAFATGCVPEGFAVSPVVTQCPAAPQAITCAASERAAHAYDAAAVCAIDDSSRAAPLAPETVGCLDAQIACSGSVSFATDAASGRDFLFLDACLPAGFETLAASCAEITTRATCRASPTPARPVRATPLATFCADPAAAFAANTPDSTHAVTVGCVDAAAVCLQQTTFARAADGQVHVFADSCLPDGFDPAPDATCPAPECLGQLIGAEFSIDCNSCTCDADGHLFCTKRRCPESAPASAPAAPQCLATHRLVDAVPALEACGDSGAPTNKAGAALQPVGCVDVSAMCLMQTTYALREADRRVFVFGTSCVPDGFRVLPGVHSCDALACANTDSDSDSDSDLGTAACPAGSVCIAHQVECFTTPCMLEPVCAAPECASHRVGEEFVLARPVPSLAGAFLCNVDCSCLLDGSLQCAPCPTASPAPDSDSDSGSAPAPALYAAGGFGLAAAAVGVFAGYRKYLRRPDDKLPLIASPSNYKSFVATNV